MIWPQKLKFKGREQFEVGPGGVPPIAGNSSGFVKAPQYCHERERVRGHDRQKQRTLDNQVPWSCLAFT